MSPEPPPQATQEAAPPLGSVSNASQRQEKGAPAGMGPDLDGPPMPKGVAREGHPFRLRRDARGKEALEHTDPHAHLRWSPRFCMDFLDSRPWPAATAFYRALVAGQGSFADITPAMMTSRDDITPLPGPPNSLGHAAGAPPLAQAAGGVPAALQGSSAPTTTWQGSVQGQAGGMPVPGPASLQGDQAMHLACGQAEGLGGQEEGQAPRRGGKRDAPEQETSGGNGPNPGSQRQSPQGAPSGRVAEGQKWDAGEPGLAPGTGDGNHRLNAGEHGPPSEAGAGPQKWDIGEQGLPSGGGKWDVGETRGGARWVRKTVRVELAYLGEAFGGYQFQRGQRTVQGVLQVALRPFCEKSGGEAGDARGVPWKTRRERREHRRQLALAQGAPQGASALQGALQGASAPQGAPQASPGAEQGPGGIPENDSEMSLTVGQDGNKGWGQDRKRDKERGKRETEEQGKEGPDGGASGGKGAGGGKESRGGKEAGEEEEEKDAAVFVAGRTDKGVSAAGQVCSFHTWRDPLDLHQVRAAIDAAAPGALRVVSVAGVPRDFHPAFSASWRRYVYLLPLLPGEGGAPAAWVEDTLETEYEAATATPGACHSAPGYSDTVPGYSDTAAADNDAVAGSGDAGCGDGAAAGSDSACGKGGAGKRLKAAGVDAGRIDAMLRELVARGPLCYTAYARNTPSHRSSGAATVCRLVRATASLVELPVGVPGGVPEGVPGGVPGGVPRGVSAYMPGGMAGGVPGGVPGGLSGRLPEGLPEVAPGGVPGGAPEGAAQGQGARGAAEGGAPAAHPPPCRALLVELIADRFLRRMVRVLVATAVREAAAGAPPDALCQLAETGERRATAPPAPAEGLCLLQVGYADKLPPPLGKH